MFFWTWEEKVLVPTSFPSFPFKTFVVYLAKQTFFAKKKNSLRHCLFTKKIRLVWKWNQWRIAAITDEKVLRDGLFSLCSAALWQPFLFYLVSKNSRKKLRQRELFKKLFIFCQIYQTWTLIINVVDISLQYAKDREARKIASTISLAYCTIKEWYYLVREQGKVPEVDQNEGELYSFGIPTYPQRLSHFFSLNSSHDCLLKRLNGGGNILKE